MGIVPHWLNRLHGNMHPTVKGWLPLVAVAAYAWCMSCVVQIPTCQFRYWLGYDCPTCGTTRATWQILTGNFSAALAMNPISYVVVAVLLRHGIVRSIPRACARLQLNSQAVDIVLLSAFFVAGFIHCGIQARGAQ